jgi:hypothetical protein
VATSLAPSANSSANSKARYLLIAGLKTGKVASQAVAWRSVEKPFRVCLTTIGDAVENEVFNELLEF